MVTSILLSNMNVCLISIDRFICLVWNPFNRKGLTVRNTLVLVMSSIAISFTLPGLASFYSNYVQNAMCIGLGHSLAVAFSITYGIMTIVVFFVTSITCIITCITVSLKLGYFRGGLQKTGDDHSINVVLRLLLVVLTNFIPSIMLTVSPLLRWFLIVFPQHSRLIWPSWFSQSMQVATQSSILWPLQISGSIIESKEYFK